MTEEAGRPAPRRQRITTQELINLNMASLLSPAAADLLDARNEIASLEAALAARERREMATQYVSIDADDIRPGPPRTMEGMAAEQLLVQEIYAGTLLNRIRREERERACRLIADRADACDLVALAAAIRGVVDALPGDPE